jgi:hypothetical protein
MCAYLAELSDYKGMLFLIDQQWANQRGNAEFANFMRTRKWHQVFVTDSSTFLMDELRTGRIGQRGKQRKKRGLF